MLEFYFNILFKNINILFQCFIKIHQILFQYLIQKHQNFYFNILFKNIKILFNHYNPVHWINRYVFVRKGEGGPPGSPCCPGTSFTQRTSCFPVPVTFHHRFLIISNSVLILLDLKFWNNLPIIQCSFLYQPLFDMKLFSHLVFRELLHFIWFCNYTNTFKGKEATQVFLETVSLLKSVSLHFPKDQLHALCVWPSVYYQSTNHQRHPLIYSLNVTSCNYQRSYHLISGLPTL